MNYYIWEKMSIFDCFKPIIFTLALLSDSRLAFQLLYLSKCCGKEFHLCLLTECKTSRRIKIGYWKSYRQLRTIKMSGHQRGSVLGHGNYFLSNKLCFHTYTVSLSFVAPIPIDWFIRVRHSLFSCQFQPLRGNSKSMKIWFHRLIQAHRQIAFPSFFSSSNRFKLFLYILNRLNASPIYY
jgi:hypothetical protein